MSRNTLLIRTMLVVLVLGAGIVLAPRLAAQDGTPATAIAVAELAPGVTAEVFAGAPSARAEGQTLYTARFIFQPGSEIFPHSYLGTFSLTVAEGGDFGWTLVAGQAFVVRGSAAGATEVSEEITEPGTEVNLSTGDAIFYEDDVIHTARGAGDESTLVFGSLLLTTGEPLLMPHEMDMGTPEA